MKRYLLCKLCFGCAAMLFLAAWLSYLPGERGTVPDGIVTMSGIVGSLEEKTDSRGKKQSILSLYSAAFCSGTFQQETTETEIETEIEQPEKGYAEITGRGVLCYLDSTEKLPLQGERIVVSGRAQAFDTERNPGGFDAALYYYADGMMFALREAHIIKREGNSNRWRQWLYACRQRFSQTAEAVCGADADVMQAMLLGERGLLLPERKRLYQAGGISHILAISGLHISILGMGLYRLLRRLGAGIFAASLAVMPVLGAYMFMTGASPSACRAVLMSCMGLMAGMLGRSQERMTSLALSALLLLVYRPLLPVRSGFLLSFGAILGLELFLPVLTALFAGRISKLFLPGFSISIVTLPCVLCTFYEFPPYSFFLNLAVLPLMGLVAGLGLLTLLVGQVFLLPARALFVPVHLLLALFEEGCRVTAGLPGGRWITGKPGLVQLFLYGILILLFYLLKRYLTKPFGLLLLLGGVWILTNPIYRGDTVTVLDVGQGDGIFLQSDEGAVLIDGGSSSEKNLAQYTLLPALKARGGKTISCVFLTHMDEDHINGIEELLERGKQEGITIQRLVLPALHQPDETYMRIASKAKAAGIHVCTMAAGETLMTAGFSFSCLHPVRNGCYEDKNAASLVLYLKKGAFSALFMGDLEGEEEGRLVKRLQETALPAGEGGAYSGRITLLKAGHHGAAASCQKELLSLCRPFVTVISCGEKNRYGHPDADTLKRLAGWGSRIYVTKERGAVTLRLCGSRVEIKTFV